MFVSDNEKVEKKREIGQTKLMCSEVGEFHVLLAVCIEKFVNVSGVLISWLELRLLGIDI